MDRFIAAVCVDTPIAIPDLRDEAPYVSSYCLLPDRAAQAALEVPMFKVGSEVALWK